MRAIPLSYVMRNLWVRRVTTALTAGGMALVVFVFATVLMMTEGINETMVTTGSHDNVVVMRKGAGVEVHSTVTRDQAAAIETLTAIATDSEGRKMVSREVVVLNNLTKRDGTVANAVLRGLSPFGVSMRPQVKLSAGRMFRPGTSEIVVGQAIAKGFANFDVGQHVHFAGRDWQVVGILNADRSAFDSEIWVDVDQAMQAYRRPAYSAMLFKLTHADAYDSAIQAVANDPRLQLDLKRETVFYAEQSEAMSKFIKLLGMSLSGIFSIGAIVGAMITMFAAVASRIGEIGTLRALGFQREAILIAFLGESLGLALVGGLIGLLGASFLQNVDVSTVNYATFSEMAFRFRFTSDVLTQTLAFSLFMGFIGGFIPAWRAARMSIIECLRQA